MPEAHMPDDDPARPDARSDARSDARTDAAERAAYHLDALHRRDEQEAREAQALIDAFVAECTRRDIAALPLHARPWSGSGRYRTGLTGWYLRPDRSVAVGTDGAFYVLVVAPERLGRLRGVRVTPSRPSLQVGKGARDGESIGLAELLALRLDDPVPA